MTPDNFEIVQNFKVDSNWYNLKGQTLTYLILMFIEH